MIDTRLTKDALYVPSIVFESGTLSSSSDGKVIWNGEELGGGTLNASGDITFTGLDTFTQHVTFNGGMICNSDIVLNGARLLLANGAAVEIYQGTDIPLPEGGGDTGSTSPGTGNSGESIDTSNFAKLNEDNTFTGNNNFAGNLTLGGKLLLNGKEIDSVVSGHNVGEQWISMDGIIPMGGLPFLGQTVSKETYSELYDWVESNGRFKTEAEWQSLYTANNGNVSFYAKVDDNTFRMPSFKGYLKANESAGGYTKEGLPNITGSVNITDNVMVNTNPSKIFHPYNGAFHQTTTSSGPRAIGVEAKVETWADGRNIEFSAQKSNSIYGNSTHVTPETNTILVGVYAFNTIINPSNLDVENLRHDITSNVESLERDISSKKGYIDYTSGVIAHGTSGALVTNPDPFTAPYDCYVVYNLRWQGGVEASPQIAIYVDDIEITFYTYIGSTQVTTSGGLFLKKGQVLRIDASYVSTYYKYIKIVYYPWN